MNKGLKIGITIFATIVVFAMGILTGMSFGEATYTEDSKESTNTTKAETVATPKTEDPKQYVEVFKFTGQGAKQSEPFTIKGDRFKVVYDYVANGFCAIEVTQTGGKYGGDVVINSLENGKSESIFYKKGDMYFDVSSCGNYSLTVYDYV